MAKNLVKEEPVALAGVIAGILLFIAAKCGIVLDEGTASSIAAGVVPIITAFIARSQVSPVSK